MIFDLVEVEGDEPEPETLVAGGPLGGAGTATGTATGTPTGSGTTDTTATDTRTGGRQSLWSVGFGDDDARHDARHDSRQDPRRGSRHDPRDGSRPSTADDTGRHSGREDDPVSAEEPSAGARPETAAHRLAVRVGAPVGAALVLAGGLGFAVAGLHDDAAAQASFLSPRGVVAPVPGEPVPTWELDVVRGAGYVARWGDVVVVDEIVGGLQAIDPATGESRWTLDLGVLPTAGR
ncbi:hypothetical protein GCM10025865_11780 [Paraoerskovia sediminicola]|uniref:Pyrroloquinoline-quinone binding quinoprotein n=1 Tax=Paraoerskovia sediminicola TaxID=1138587 RepID=A0ABM8G176_9CELL|nr:hypothetical protein GCM10025865_11780 [Paraoerskovia sediminicola]